MAAPTKKPSSKAQSGTVCRKGSWVIVAGKLKRPRGRPSKKVQSLFKAVGEKIPLEFLNDVEKHLHDIGLGENGVYIAHDSMGYPRYIGRGNIFRRIDARRKAQVLELAYFSFFVVEDIVHRRELETIMIRAAGPLLDFNSRKVRIDIQPGDIKDFEPGTHYVERQYKKGKKNKSSRTREKT